MTDDIGHRGEQRREATGRDDRHRISEFFLHTRHQSFNHADIAPENSRRLCRIRGFSNALFGRFNFDVRQLHRRQTPLSRSPSSTAKATLVFREQITRSIHRSYQRNTSPAEMVCRTPSGSSSSNAPSLS
ncbi:MAG: hypothetical protein O3B08_10705, partial [Proteobacteria bacterium]|nr:hypothetical protein [Pseudomonadota bacterium]